MYHTETTSEGRLLHDWFTSKHRLISVVSSAPSQAVSPESSVSEELPCVISPPPRQWRHAHMQAGLWHYDEKDSQRQNRNTANAQPASAASIIEATGTSLRTHPVHRPSCWQCVQSETMPPAMRFSTGHSVSQSFLFLREHMPIPMVCCGGNPIRSRNHGNSQTYGI